MRQKVSLNPIALANCELNTLSTATGNVSPPAYASSKLKKKLYSRECIVVYDFEKET